MKWIGISFCLVIFVFSACKTKTAANPDFAYEYMPLEIGQYIIYDADSVAYDKFSNSKRSFKFQIKEKVESQFKDNIGQDFYKIGRYKRRQDSLGNFVDSTFILKTIFTSAIAQNSLQVVEDNQKYVRLVFPPNLNQEWNANVYNNNGEQMHFIQILNEKISLNKLSYENVCQVVELKSNPEIKIFKKYKYTTYARNIGIIEKYQMDIASQKNLSLPIEERIEEGNIYHLKLKRYGKE